MSSDTRHGPKLTFADRVSSVRETWKATRLLSGEADWKVNIVPRISFCMSRKHNTIIAAGAKVELERLGFRQQGRSRLWLADHQSWLNVIQFTPDRWSKGTSLVNAVHWLWAGTGFLAFHASVSSRSHAKFETNEQFAGVVTDIARESANNAAELQAKFSSLERTADFAIDRARSSPERMRPSWWGYQAGIASGLIGRFDDAAFFLSGITDERVTIHSAPLLSLTGNPDKFKSRVNELVNRQRDALHLTRLELSPF
ncbi:MAG: hypothetical protein JO273_04490 [Methylobacteriaceae bacterium]|nr:hypothetical protein [Methylobacteriaceae bacterium]